MFKSQTTCNYFSRLYYCLKYKLQIKWFSLPLPQFFWMDEREVHILHKNPLQIAIKVHNLSEIAMLIHQFKCDVLKKDENGHTPLLVCVQNNELEALKIVVEDMLKNSGYNHSYPYLKNESSFMKIFSLRLMEQNSDSNGNSPLHIACIYGCVDVVKYLAEVLKCDINTANSEGMSCMHMSTKHGHTNIVKYLINDLQCQQMFDKCGRTPAYIAAEAGHINILKLYVKEKIPSAQCYTSRKDFVERITENCNILGLFHLKLFNNSKKVKFASSKDDNELYLLYLACIKGATTIIDILLQNHFILNPNQETLFGGTCVHAACCGGNLKLVKTLITSYKCKYNQKGITPVFFALQEGHVDIFEYFLVELKINPKRVTKDGLSYVHAACVSGNLNIVHRLVEECGCNPHSITSKGITPLYVACWYGYKDIVSYLLSKGGNPYLFNNKMSCLYAAKFIGNMDIIDILKSCDHLPRFLTNVELDSAPFKEIHEVFLEACKLGELNSVIYLSTLYYKENDFKHLKNLWEGVHYACTFGHLEILKCLLRTKFMLNKFCVQGRANVYNASAKGYLSIVQYLTEDCGLDAKYRNENGDTPLHAACVKGHFNIAKYLITKHRCDPMSKNYTTHSCFHLACRSKNLSLVKYLVEECNCDPKSTYQAISINVEHSDISIYQNYNKYNCSYSKVNVLDDLENNIGEFNGLYIACDTGDLSVLKYLLKYITEYPSAQLFIGGLNGGHLNIVQYVIKYCDLGYFCRTFKYPFHMVCAKGHIDVLKYLLNEHIFDLDTTNEVGWTGLHLAAIEGHLNIIKCLVEDYKCDPNCKEVKGCTPLYYACLNGHADIMQYLIVSHGADPNMKTKDGYTCLHGATIRGSKNVVESLIDNHNCNVNERTSNESTPLIIACQFGHYEIVNYLTNHRDCDVQCADINRRTCLHIACEYGQEKIVSHIMEAVTGINLDSQDKEGITPFFLACQQGHYSIAKILASENKRCCIFIKTNNGQTSLHAAAASGDIKTVQFLTEEHNFDAVCRDNNGSTPLFSACRYGYLEVVIYLIKLNADPLDLIKDSTSCLHAACASGNLDLVKYLIDECKCDPHSQNEDRLTPFHTACKEGQMTIAEYLIGKKLHHLFVKTKKKQSCLHLACYSGNKKLVEYISSKFFKCIDEVRDSNGFSPLHVACQQGHKELVQFLTQIKHCDLNSVTCDGLSSLHVAISVGKLDIIKYILKYESEGFTLFKKIQQLIYSLPINCYVKSNSNTLVHIAAEFGQLKVVKYFLQTCKYDPNVRETNGVVPLHLAAYGGHFSIVKFLIEEIKCDKQFRDTFSNTPLHYAAASGHLKLVKYLYKKLDYNFEPWMSTELEDSKIQKHCSIGTYSLSAVYRPEILQEKLTEFRTTPLHCAAAYGHMNVIEYFIDACGWNPNLRDANNDTPFHVASRNCQLEVLKYFIESGLVKYDTVGGSNITAFHCASATGHLPVISYLMTVCNNNNTMLIQPDDYKRTPLHYACAGGHIDVVKYVGTRVAILDSLPDFEKNSPLHLAVSYGDLDVIKYLVGFSPDKEYYPRILDISCENFERKKPKDLAYAASHYDLYQFLVEEEDRDAVMEKSDSLLSTSSFNILVLGSCKVGKSTLVKALSEKKRFNWFFSRPINDVVPNTTSTIQHTISNKIFGCVRIYDMPGDEQFIGSHEVILEEIYNPLVVVVVDLSQDLIEIRTQLEYWTNVLSTVGESSQQIVNAIIVGSHLDKTDSTLFHDGPFQEYIKGKKNPRYHDFVFLDCRYPNSKEMKLFHQLISSVQQIMFYSKPKDDYTGKEYAIALFRYLQHLPNTDFITLKQLHKNILNIQHPDAKIRELCNLKVLDTHCEYLSKNGQILYLKHKCIVESSVEDPSTMGKKFIVLDGDNLQNILKVSLIPRLLELNKIDGIEEESDLKQSDGIVEESVLKEIISEFFSPSSFDLDAVIDFLLFSLFCSEISYEKLCAIKSLNAESRYFIFPSLRSYKKARPNNYILWNDEFSAFVWCIKATNDKFFTSNYVHALLVKVINAQDDLGNITLWKNGVSLVHGNGTRAVIEVTDHTKKLYLAIQCPKHCMMELVKRRSELWIMTKELLNMMCHNLKFSESILYMQHKVYPPINFEEIPIAELAKAIIGGVRYVVLKNENKTQVSISDLLYKDFFYATNKKELKNLIKLTQNRSSDDHVPSDIRHNIVEKLHLYDINEFSISYQQLYKIAIKYTMFTSSTFIVSFNVILYSDKYIYIKLFL